MNHTYAKDANTVFYLSGKIKDADAATFTAFPELPGNEGNSYAKDKNNVYFHISTIGKPKILKGADPATFQVVGNNYGMDTESVYYENWRIKGADVASWRLLDGSRYSQDKKNVYCGGEIIKGADTKSFQVLPDGDFARDKNNYYFQNLFTSREKYLDEFRKYVIFTGCIEKITLIDGRNDKEVHNAAIADYAHNWNYHLRFQIRCERVVFDSGVKREATPIPGEPFYFRKRPPSDFADWIGKPWIWCCPPFHREPQSLAPILYWQDYCPVDRLESIELLVEELTGAIG